MRSVVWSLVLHTSIHIWRVDVEFDAEPGVCLIIELFIERSLSKYHR